MHKLYFNRIYDNELSLTDIENFLTNYSAGFDLVYQYSYIGSCQSSLDVMQDHLQLSYCIERILKYADLVDHEVNHTFRAGITFSLIPRDIPNLAALILELCVIDTSERDPDEWDIFFLREEMIDYEETLEHAVLKFPDAIDDYLANFVNQGIFELASEYCIDEQDGEVYDESLNFTRVENQRDSDETGLTTCEERYLAKRYNANPEWKWGIWRSPISSTLNEVLYVSSYCWIIPKTSDYKKILLEYSGFKKEIHFEKASILEYGINKIAINNYGAIELNSLDAFNNATQCVNVYLNQHLKLPTCFAIKLENSSIFISEYRDVLMIESENFRFVYFDFRIVGSEELKRIWERLSAPIAYLQNLLGLTTQLKCNWQLLTDETFEDLCYDFLYIHTKFDSSKIRKMGKSRSRDGGRDIVAYTNPVWGKEAEMYIFQCKFTTQNRSLAKSSVPEAANVIMEYGAAGYGIFTTTVIDATLHDMLDGFSKNNDINTDMRFSIYELERWLAANQGLRKKYFGG